MLDKYILVQLLPYLLAFTVLESLFYEKTKPIIELQQAQKTQQLLSSVYSLNSNQSIKLFNIEGVKPLILDANGQSQYWLVCNQHAEPDGVILPVRSSEGYAGDIDLLIALQLSSKVLGVKVLKHIETPGLGDKIEQRRSNWLSQFISANKQSNWEVKTSVKNGFDSLTAATITSRAVINMFPKSIVWMEQFSPNLKLNCTHGKVD